jgi:outer membrane protein assembly factor BamB
MFLRTGLIGLAAATLTAASMAMVNQASATVGGTLQAVGDAGKQVTVTVGTGKSARDQTFRLADTTRVTLDGKPAKPADLKSGMRISVTYDKTSREATGLRATTVKAPPVEAPAPSEAPARPTKKATAKPRGDAARAGAADWPQFRGPDRNGISNDTGLLKEWPAEGPRLAWRISGLGEGFSSVSISGGRIYTMGNRGGEEYIIALDLDGGSELWATSIGPARGNGGGYAGPRCIPPVDGDLVFGLGIDGTLACLEAATGKPRWRKSLVSDFGGRMMSGWGYSESPLVDGEKLICTPGGDRATMAALNKNTGQTLWTCAAPNSGGAAYSSPVMAEPGGLRQYITLVGRGIIGVSARDGRHLWTYNRIANGTANIPTPLVRGDLVFCATGYNAGAALLRLVPAGGGCRVEERYFLSGNEFQNHHGGFVLVDKYLYAGHGHNNGLPTCIELNSGRRAWGPERGPGSGSAAVTYADGHVYFRYQNGVVALVEATPAEFKLKGTFRIPGGSQPSWPHPVVTGGRLYLRDQDQLFCYDLRG